MPEACPSRRRRRQSEPQRKEEANDFQGEKSEGAEKGGGRSKGVATRRGGCSGACVLRQRHVAVSKVGAAASARHGVWVEEGENRQDAATEEIRRCNREGALRCGSLQSLC